MDAVLKFMGKLVHSNEEISTEIQPQTDEFVEEIKKARTLLRNEAVLDEQARLDKIRNKRGNLGG